MRIKTLILMLLVAATHVGAWATPRQAADSAYRAGRYAEAAELYQKAIAADGTSAQILYNLGNAYMRSGAPGDAVLYYERALRLAPGNADVRNNLEYAAAKVADRNRADLRGKQVSVAEDEASFVGRVHDSITRRTSSDAWAWWAAGCFIAFCGLAAVYIFCSGVWMRKVGFFGGMVAGVASIIFIVFAFMAAGQAGRTNEGVIIAFKTQLRTEPKNSAPAAAAPLNRGTKLTVLDTETDTKGKVTWYKVRRNSNYVGWVKVSDFEII